MSVMSVFARIVSVMALLVPATSAFASQAQPDPLATFKRAVALQQSGALDEAVAAYRDFLDAHPNNVEARSNLGVTLARLGRYEEAIAAYHSALAVDDSRTAVRLNLGIALYKTTRFQEAVTELSRVSLAEPDNLQARYLEADCHLRMGQPKRVIELLAPLEGQRTTDLALAYMLGLAYLQDGQRDKGQLLVDRIFRSGESAEARLMMGQARRAAQDMPGAVEELGKAVALNPELPSVHALYGQALLETGDRDRAREQFAEELKRNPLDFDANMLLGVILKEEAQYETALKSFERALQVRPRDIATRFQIATVHVGLGETAKALELLEPIVKETPDFLEAHVTLATVYYRLKRKEEGDRERAVVDELQRAIQAKQPKPKPMERDIP
jgi:tetratricopeptide (TPR) repeat protein